MPLIQDVNSNLQINTPQSMSISIANQASDMVSQSSRVQSRLATLFGSRQISTVYTPTNGVQVILEVKPDTSRSIALSGLYVQSSSGDWFPSGQLQNSPAGSGPLLVKPFWGSLPAATISFNLRSGRFAKPGQRSRSKTVARRISTCDDNNQLQHCPGISIIVANLTLLC